MSSTTRSSAAAMVLIGLVCFNAGAGEAQKPAMPPPPSDRARTPEHRVDLFNGRNFDGWTFCMKNHADPARTWSVAHGVIHCTGRPAGYLRTDAGYRDYRLFVEWRFVKVTPRADNTGVLVQMQLPDKVWPKCVQIQGKHERQGDMFLMAGAESREHRGMDPNTPVPRQGASAEHPVGQWNTCEAVCSGRTVRAFINGKFANQATDCTVTSGFIGIQSEGGDIEIRKVYLEPLVSKRPLNPGPRRKLSG